MNGKYRIKQIIEIPETDDENWAFCGKENLNSDRTVIVPDKNNFLEVCICSGCFSKYLDKVYNENYGK